MTEAVCVCIIRHRPIFYRKEDALKLIWSALKIHLNVPCLWQINYGIHSICHFQPQQIPLQFQPCVFLDLLELGFRDHQSTKLQPTHPHRHVTVHPPTRTHTHTYTLRVKTHPSHLTWTIASHWPTHTHFIFIPIHPTSYDILVLPWKHTQRDYPTYPPWSVHVLNGPPTLPWHIHDAIDLGYHRHLWSLFIRVKYYYLLQLRIW